MDYLSIAMGKNIRKLRKAKGMSQWNLADELYTDAGSICRWEKGAFTPSAHHILMIVRALGCSFEDLYKGCEG